MILKRVATVRPCRCPCYGPWVISKRDRRDDGIREGDLSSVASFTSVTR